MASGEGIIAGGGRKAECETDLKRPQQYIVFTVNFSGFRITKKPGISQMAIFEAVFPERKNNAGRYTLNVGSSSLQAVDPME